MEMLYTALAVKNYNPNLKTYWSTIIGDVQKEIHSRYQISKITVYGIAIAKSFLSMTVKKQSLVDPDKDITYLKLEEAGLIALEEKADQPHSFYKEYRLFL